MGMFGMFGKKNSGIDPLTGEYGGDMVVLASELTSGVSKVLPRPKPPLNRDWRPPVPRF